MVGCRRWVEVCDGFIIDGVAVHFMESLISIMMVHLLLLGLSDAATFAFLAFATVLLEH